MIRKSKWEIFRLWAQGLVKILKLNVWLRLWNWIFVDILKLGLVKILKFKFCGDADVWLRFPLCLWQCLNISDFNGEIKRKRFKIMFIGLVLWYQGEIWTRSGHCAVHICRTICHTYCPSDGADMAPLNITEKNNWPISIFWHFIIFWETIWGNMPLRTAINCGLELRTYHFSADKLFHLSFIGLIWLVVRKMKWVESYLDFFVW